MASFFITSIIEQEFNKAIIDCKGNIEQSLYLLFENIEKEMLRMKKWLFFNSGSTCNVTVFDYTYAKVYVASLGDSPTLKYVKNDQNQHYLYWRSRDQDCADPQEVERMVEIHKKNGDVDTTSSSVVYQDKTNGKNTGVWRNKLWRFYSLLLSWYC
jgi:hypothetical protein